MALNWSKEISFSGLKKSKAKPNNEYPEKTYMNLVVSTKREVDTRKTVITGVIALIAVILVVKFGVFDFYARVNDKVAELNVQQQNLNVLNTGLAKYDAVLSEYESYESISVTADGLVVNAVDALALVDRYIAPSASIMSISLAGDTMAINVTDISLDGVGQLVSTLYAQDMVANVSVATAATAQTASSDVTAALTITLKPSLE